MADIKPVKVDSLPQIQARRVLPAAHRYLCLEKDHRWKATCRDCRKSRNTLVYLGIYDTLREAVEARSAHLASADHKRCASENHVRTKKNMFVANCKECGNGRGPGLVLRNCPTKEAAIAAMMFHFESREHLEAIAPHHDFVRPPPVPKTSRKRKLSSPRARQSAPILASLARPPVSMATAQAVDFEHRYARYQGDASSPPPTAPRVRYSPNHSRVPVAYPRHAPAARSTPAKTTSIADAVSRLRDRVNLLEATVTSLKTFRGHEDAKFWRERDLRQTAHVDEKSPVEWLTARVEALENEVIFLKYDSSVRDRVDAALSGPQPEPPRKNRRVL